MSEKNIGMAEHYMITFSLACRLHPCAEAYFRLFLKQSWIYLLGKSLNGEYVVILRSQLKPSAEQVSDFLTDGMACLAHHLMQSVILFLQLIMKTWRRMTQG